MSEELEKQNDMIAAIEVLFNLGILSKEAAEKAIEDIKAVAAKPVVAPVEEPAAVEPPKPKRIKVVKGKDVPVAPDLVDQFVAWFFTTPMDQLYDVTRGQYECRVGSKEKGIAHTLIFHSERKVSVYDEKTKTSTYKVEDPEDANNVIGIRPVESTIGVFNASRIMYGTANKAQQRPQAAAEKAGAVPIPFQNVVSKSGGAGMDLSTLQIVDWKGSEKMIIPPISRLRDWVGDFYVIERHFAGAMVIRVEDKYFLFDADREELHRFGFNPFFTQLPGPAKTVEEAYEQLMPEAVKVAQKEGKKVQRQGEFFFIPMTELEALTFINGHVGKNVDDSVFNLLNITRQLVEVGAAHYNWLQAERWVQISRFKEQCNQHNEGYLPEGQAKHKANELFDPYLQELSVYVGSKMAQGIYDDVNTIDESKIKALKLELANTKNRNYEYWTPANRAQLTRTHLAGIANSLMQQFRPVIDSTHGNAAKPNQQYGNFGIMMDVRIGETVAEADWRERQRQHRATAVVRGSGTKEKELIAIGTVVHMGREHRPVYLDTWHKVIANTATNNWTVSGDVD